jgi:transposase
MMGVREPQKDLFSYQVDLDKRVRQNHPLRAIDREVDFTFVRAEVAEHYGSNGNVSEDPAVIAKMTKSLKGHVFTQRALRVTSSHVT